MTRTIMALLKDTVFIHLGMQCAFATLKGMSENWHQVDQPRPTKVTPHGKIAGQVFNSRSPFVNGNKMSCLFPILVIIHQIMKESSVKPWNLCRIVIWPNMGVGFMCGAHVFDKDVNFILPWNILAIYIKIAITAKYPYSIADKSLN